jgi:glycosyltransferase involved in cell wall biosynthesis
VATGPLKIILFAPTADRLVGADRDWVSLANALGPDRVRVCWIGVRGSECIRDVLDPRVCAGLLDLGLVPFHYPVFDDAHRQRSAWLWSKIVVDYALRCVAALRGLAGTVPWPPDVVVSTTATVQAGAAFSIWHRLPHLWCVKECLDPSLRSTRLLARWIERASAAVVVPSSAVAVPFSPGALVFPDGNDVGAITRTPLASARASVYAELGLPADRPLFIQVGGNIRLKGAHVTAQAFARLCASRAQPPCSLVFLGEPSPAYRREIEALVAGGGPTASDHLRFAYFEPQDFRYLAAADVVLHPSVGPDSFPNAVREAMILGKPVIGTRVGGIPEMIRDGETGLLVSPGDAPALLQSWITLLDRPDLREHLGRRAAAFARKAFDIEKTKRAYQALLWRMAGRDGDEDALSPPAPEPVRATLPTS